ncbi:MAG: polysaccharide biosynthesis C-terminal domain-containing protein [Bacteroidota bacterium]
MGIVFRQSAKNTLVSITGAMLGALVIWLSTNYIPKRELGFIGNITNYAVISSNILLLGLNITMVVFVHRFANDHAKKRVLLTMALAIPTAITVVGAIVYNLMRGWIIKHFQPEDIPFMDRYFLWLPFFTLLFMYVLALEQYLGSQFKVAISAFMREVLLRVLNILLILLFAFGYIDFHILVLGTILVYLVPVIIFFFLAANTEGFGISFDFKVFSRSEYREIAQFTWYHFLFVITALLIGMMDALLLPFYDHSGFASVAVFRVSVFFISFLMIPQKAMIIASFTVLAKAFADNDMAKARDIFTRSSVNIFLATMLVAALLCCNLPEIMPVVRNDYAAVTPVFLILFLGNIVNIATGMNDQVLSIANYYKFNFFLSLAVMLILFILLRALIPAYGIYGAAWGTTIAYLIFNVCKYTFVLKKLDMQPFTPGTLRIIAAGIAAFCAGYFLPHFFSGVANVYTRAAAEVLLRTTIITVVYSAMILWLKPSEDVETYIASIRKNKRLF